jgi:dCTP diphosphatase
MTVMPTKRLINISALEAELQKFADERGWQKYHSPKNLAMALTGEVGELVELFQWLTEEESMTLTNNPKTATAVQDELADVFLYLVRLSSVLGVDMNDAIIEKLYKNAQKYPSGDSTPTR